MSDSIANIVREMRKANFQPPWYQEQINLYADRIEAAHGREVGVSKTETTTKKSLGVGNGAKRREALERCVKMLDICLLYSHEGYPEQNDDIRDVMAQAENALSAPARPCDTMPWRDAWAKWRSEFHPATPVTYKECYDSTAAFMDWYMSAAESEAAS